MFRIRSRGLSGPCGLYLAGLKGSGSSLLCPRSWRPGPGAVCLCGFHILARGRACVWWERCLIKNQGPQPKFGDFFCHQEFAPNFIPKLAPPCLRPALSPLRFYISQTPYPLESPFLPGL